ncbi:MAG: hypothetical protein ICV78_20430 [Tolypothrix sp. Co-bin9]|nr:hypothetical protein [Tolypothrix sp. Co-bin9]
MLDPGLSQFLSQQFANKYLPKNNNISWDNTRQAMRVSKGTLTADPSNIGLGFDQNHSWYATGDFNNGPSIRLHREFTGVEFRGVSAQGSSTLGLFRLEGSLLNPAPVTSGLTCGSIRFFGWDGSTFQNSAQIIAVVAGPVSTGSVPMALEFWTGTNGARTAKLRVTPNGGLVLANSPGNLPDPGLGNLSIVAVTNGLWQATPVGAEYIAASRGTDVSITESFLTPGATSTILQNLGIQGFVSGTGATINTTSATTSGLIAGGWSFITGGTSTGFAALRSVTTNAFNFAVNRQQNLLFRLRIPNSPNVTDDANVFFGFGNSTSGAEPTDGIYFLANSSNPNWVTKVVVNGTVAALSVTNTVINNSFNVFRIAINSGGTIATFYINDIIVSTATGLNLSGRMGGINSVIAKLAGTTSLSKVVDTITYFTA